MYLSTSSETSKETLTRERNIKSRKIAIRMRDRSVKIKIA